MNEYYASSICFQPNRKERQGKKDKGKKIFAIQHPECSTEDVRADSGDATSSADPGVITGGAGG